MRKVTITVLAAALIMAAAAVLLFTNELHSPTLENSAPPVEVNNSAEAYYNNELYEEFNDALAQNDYTKANQLYSKNFSETGVNFPVESFDSTFGGKIYAYEFDVSANKDTGEKAAHGTLYVVDPNLNLTTLSSTENDYFALDYRTNADPEFVVLDSYRAEGTNLIRELCSILLSHEEKYPSKWERTIDSLEEEWKVHNLAYELDYKIDRAKDVNLNNNDENTDWLQRAIDESN